MSSGNLLEKIYCTNLTMTTYNVQCIFYRKDSKSSWELDYCQIVFW